MSDALGLCEEMLAALGLAIAALWAHIVVIHRAIVRRLDEIAGKK